MLYSNERIYAVYWAGVGQVFKPPYLNPTSIALDVYSQCTDCLLTLQLGYKCSSAVSGSSKPLLSTQCDGHQIFTRICEKFPSLLRNFPASGLRFMAGRIGPTFHTAPDNF
jgi:hypothetical protein